MPLNQTQKNPVNNKNTNTMDKDTLLALKESISHWENMRDHGFEQQQPFSKQCSLCNKFLNKDCVGCPVYRAGFKSCRRTPYETAWENYHVTENLIEFKKSAAEEVEFLKSLLPDEEN